MNPFPRTRLRCQCSSREKRLEETKKGGRYSAERRSHQEGNVRKLEEELEPLADKESEMEDWVDSLEWRNDEPGPEA